MIYFKKIIYFLAIFAFSAISLIAIVNIYNYYIPGLNEKSVDFFIKNKSRIPDNENSAYAIIGFNAPQDVVDIHAFGLNKVNKMLGQYLEADNKHIHPDASLPEVEGELTFVGDVYKLSCWVGSSINDSQFQNSENCYALNELRDVVERNTVLLERQEKLKDYKYYSGSLLLATNGSLIINVHRLFLANMKLALDRGEQDIFDNLIRDLKYRRLMLSQPGSLIDKAINLVLYNMTLEQLEYAITYETELAIKHEKMIDQVLSDLKDEEFNIDGVFIQEFQTLNSILCIDETLGIDTEEYCHVDAYIDYAGIEYVMNDYYEFYLRYKNMMSLDIESLSSQCSASSDKSLPSFYMGLLFHLPIFVTYTTYDLVKSGLDKGCELMGTYKLKSAKHRLMKVYLDIKREGLKPEDIPGFLQSKADKDYLTGKPFVYDKDNNAMTFPDMFDEKLNQLNMKL